MTVLRLLGLQINVNTSTTWQIQNVQAKCDIIALDSGLNESYMKLLEEGKKLTLNYNAVISQYKSIIGQTDISINITRSLTRLKKVCVSFWKDYAAEPRTFMLTSKHWNEFFSPAPWKTIRGSKQYNVVGEFQCQLQNRL